MRHKSITHLINNKYKNLFKIANVTLLFFSNITKNFTLLVHRKVFLKQLYLI